MNGHIIILDAKQMREGESTDQFAARVLSQRLMQNADLVAVSFENAKSARILKRRSHVGMEIDHSDDETRIEVIA